MRNRHRLQITRGIATCRANAHSTRRIAFIPGNFDSDDSMSALRNFIDACATGNHAKWAFTLRKTGNGVRVIARYGS